MVGPASVFLAIDSGVDATGIEAASPPSRLRSWDLGKSASRVKARENTQKVSGNHAVRRGFTLKFAILTGVSVYRRHLV